MNKKNKDKNEAKANSRENATHTQVNSANKIFPELIVKILIDKLISRVKTEKQRMNFEKIIDAYMIDYSINTFQALLQSNYVAYDQDDYLVNNQQQQQQHLNGNYKDETPIFFDIKKDKDNSWEEIYEPSRRKTEREASSLIKVAKFDNESLEDQKPERKQNQVIKDDDSTSRLNLKLEPINRMNINNNQANVQNLPLKLDPNVFVPLQDKNSIDIISFELLNKEELTYKEREGDAQLRMNHEIEKIKKKDQMQKMVEDEKKKRNSRNFVIRQHREFNGSVHTFDSNGKVIHIDRKNPEHLPNDFQRLKQQVKEVRKIENTLFRKSVSQRLLAKNINRESQVIEYNPYENDLEAYAAQNKKKTNKGVFTPCGSAFDLIQPATGVKVFENERTKEGSSDYLKKYKKTSFNEYTQMFNDSMLYNNNSSKRLILMSSQLKETNGGNANDNEATLLPLNQQQQNLQRQHQPYVGYKENIQSSHNPLVQNAEQRSNSVDTTINKNSRCASQEVINSKLNPLIAKRRRNSSGINSEYINGFSDSIRRVFDLPENSNLSNNDMSLSLLRNHNNSSLHLLKTRNRLDLKMSSQFQSNQSLKETNVMDSFNRSILLSKKKQDWGNEVRIGRPNLIFNEIYRNQSYSGSLERHCLQLKLKRTRSDTRKIHFTPKLGSII